MVKKRRGDQLVEPRDDGWAVRTHQAKRATLVVGSKALAIDRAMNLARERDAGVVVHDERGKVQARFDPDDDTMFLAYT